MQLVYFGACLHLYFLISSIRLNVSVSLHHGLVVQRHRLPHLEGHCLCVKCEKMTLMTA